MFFFSALVPYPEFVRTVKILELLKMSTDIEYKLHFRLSRLKRTPVREKLERGVIDHL